ncbi:MAG: class I SAM-dependent methyltransferase [Xanthomonadaceae bacterium]|nr:class I SAM-dependent methyltransferase [Xanthomonadaceae bacterium]
MRELAGRGIDVLGVDAVPGRVEAARETGGGRFATMDHAGVAAGDLDAQADTVVCNFSLFCGAPVEHLLAAMPRLPVPGGAVVIQTPHPWSAVGDEDYRDGWRAGSWAGWRRIFLAAGLTLREVVEPLPPQTGRPASILFTLAIDDPAAPAPPHR